jgi:predicted transcriptional regulator of viral defense system
VREIDALHRLRDTTADQAGFVTSAQARRTGVTGQMMDKLARRGLLRRVRHGVYTLELGPHYPDETLASAWLAVDPKPFPWERAAQPPLAVVSHASAAALRGLGTIIPTLPDLTQTTQGSRREEIHFHIAPLHRADWDWLDANGLRLPVTTPARTIVDLLLDHEETDHLTRALHQTYESATTARDDLTAASERRKHHHGRLVTATRALIRDAFGAYA